MHALFVVEVLKRQSNSPALIGVCAAKPQHFCYSLNPARHKMAPTGIIICYLSIAYMVNHG